MRNETARIPGEKEAEEMRSDPCLLGGLMYNTYDTAFTRNLSPSRLELEERGCES